MMPKTVDGITEFNTLREALDFACDADWIEAYQDKWRVVTSTSMHGQELKDKLTSIGLDISRYEV